MATVQQVTGDLVVLGSITSTGTITGPNNRQDRNLETDLEFPIGLHAWKVWDAYQTNLGTGSADDLGFNTGTFGTGTPVLTSGDLNAAGATVRYARNLYQIPYEFVGGQDFRFRIAAGMFTSVASVAATADVEIRVSNGQGGITGSDLVTTSAQSINSLTIAQYDFLCTGLTLERGDVIDIRLNISANSVTASAHYAAIIRTALLWPAKS